MNKEIESLVSRTAVKWIGLQLAIDQDEIIWDHSDIDYLQFYSLELHLGDQEILTIEAGLDDDFEFYELKIKRTNTPISKNGEEIFMRVVALNDFPIGKIEKVEKEIDENGKLIKLLLIISDQKLEIVAGEIDWNKSQPFVSSPNEFLLVSKKYKPQNHNKSLE